MAHQTFSDKQTGLVTLSSSFSVSSEISSITSLMTTMTVLGKQSSPSYRLLKTVLSNLKDFQKINK